jgi:COMPASS component SWD2
MAEKLELGAVIQGDGVVTNLAFHEKGQHLVFTTNESTIYLVDALAGEEKKKIYAKTAGIGKVQYTHSEQCILSSSLTDFNINYLCLFDNRYLRHFKEHTDYLTSLSMNPTTDTFLSASQDGTICMWDMLSPSATSKITLPKSAERPFVSYDSAGLVFGVLCQDAKTHSSSLKLYDARNYSSGPFESIFPKSDLMKQAVINQSSKNGQAPLTAAQVDRLVQSQWNSFEFSTDSGNSILVNSSAEAIFLLNGFNAHEEPKVILNRKNDAGLYLAATFSADSKQIITGNDENEILIFDAESAELSQTLTGHNAPVGCIQCNKVYEVMASGCVNTALWI